MRGNGRSLSDNFLDDTSFLVNLGFQITRGLLILPTQDICPFLATGPTAPVEHLYQHGRLAITKLFNAPARDVVKYDIVICACGLLGAEDVDIGAMLRLLDTWAGRCRAFIGEKVSLFHANPGKFGSLARFCVGAIANVITRQFGVRYNPLLAANPVENPDPITDPADTFIHGILGPRRVGTCATLPVVLVAIGRRLGYPLKLALAPQHAFCRWDTADERFNVEFDERGLSYHADDHYKEWPFKWNQRLYDRERRRPYFLLSLAPQQELAYFAFERAVSLDVLGNSRRREALATMQAAQRLWPAHNHEVWITHLATKVSYPEREWPHTPCEETAGRAAMERLVRDGRAMMVDVP